MADAGMGSQQITYSPGLVSDGTLITITSSGDGVAHCPAPKIPRTEQACSGSGGLDTGHASDSRTPGRLVVPAEPANAPRTRPQDGDIEIVSSSPKTGSEKRGSMKSTTSSIRAARLILQRQQELAAAKKVEAALAREEAELKLEEAKLDALLADMSSQTP